MRTFYALVTQSESLPKDQVRKKGVLKKIVSEQFVENTFLRDIIDGKGCFRLLVIRLFSEPESFSEEELILLGQIFEECREDFFGVNTGEGCRFYHCGMAHKIADFLVEETQNARLEALWVNNNHSPQFQQAIQKRLWIFLSVQARILDELLKEEQAPFT
jgi:hypothetical protein